MWRKSQKNTLITKEIAMQFAHKFTSRITKNHKEFYLLCGFYFNVISIRTFHKLI
jgi:hypothetical protein